MEKHDSLEELLSLVGAKITRYNHEHIHVSGKLPNNVAALTASYNISTATSPINVFNDIIDDFDVYYVDYSYIFKTSDETNLILELLLATEKVRYERFCKSIDNEITEHLSSKE